jgi:hypothetical protein
MVSQEARSRRQSETRADGGAASSVSSPEVPSRQRTGSSNERRVTCAACLQRFTTATPQRVNRCESVTHERTNTPLLP